MSWRFIQFSFLSTNNLPTTAVSFNVLKLIARHKQLRNREFIADMFFALWTNTDEKEYDPGKNNLTVPTVVRGMKTLNRDKFKKKLKVNCYFFEQTKAHQALKLIKPYLLKIDGFNPVQQGYEMCCRVAYLDPVKAPNGFSSFSQNDKAALLEMGCPGETSARKLILGYENFKADEILRAVIPPELESVSGYSMVGHIIHLNLRPELAEYKSVIGNVLLDKVPNAQTVVTKTDNIESTFRNFQMEVIAGLYDFQTKVHENQCVYSFDFSRVYWNPRLSREHRKVVSMLNKGDVLFDVFCGVGPFVIPAAKVGIRCFANDLNPAAISSLEKNIEDNKIDPSLVSFWGLDGNVFIKEKILPAFLELTPGKYQVLVTMNLPALAPSVFCSFKHALTLKEFSSIPESVSISARVYCFVKCPQPQTKTEAKKLIETELDMTLDEEIESIEFVRNVAPNKDMMAVQVKLTKRILVGKKRVISEGSLSPEVESIDVKKLKQ